MLILLLRGTLRRCHIMNHVENPYKTFHQEEDSPREMRPCILLIMPELTAENYKQLPTVMTWLPLKEWRNPQAYWTWNYKHNKRDRPPDRNWQSSNLISIWIPQMIIHPQVWWSCLWHIEPGLSSTREEGMVRPYGKKTRTVTPSSTWSLPKIKRMRNRHQMHIIRLPKEKLCL